MLSREEINKKLEQLKIEDFIWVIYIFIIFISWYSNNLERNYFIYNDLESKDYPHFYAGGEILNVNGDCGGYNLHFAFASGYRIFKVLERNQNVKN